MADISTVRAKIQDALDEADTALGNPTTTSQLATLKQQVADAQAAAANAEAQVVQLKGKITAAQAALV